MNVGQCPCGEPIAIGDSYKVLTKGPYTIKRPCPKCPRINEVVLRVSITVERATWKVLECHCGEPIYLRRDYTGEGNGLFETPRDKKNRTVVQYCRRCTCRWRFVIRFKKSTDPITRLIKTVRHTQAHVRKDRSCPGEESAGNLPHTG